MEINICHLYPDVLNLYGDRGNIFCLEKRLLWRGIKCNIDTISLGEMKDFSKYDIFFIGGGQDFEQEVLLSDLQKDKASQIKSTIEDGRVYLAICGGYQMLGHYYQTQKGVKYDYISAIDFYTKAGNKRLINNYAFKVKTEEGVIDVVGFENHSGRTYLADGIKPLGKIIKGNGNNGEDGSEGVRYKNVFGTYCHGPILPKNPKFCDEIIRTAIFRKYGTKELMPLNDEIENKAHEKVLKQILNEKV